MTFTEFALGWTSSSTSLAGWSAQIVRRLKMLLCNKSRNTTRCTADKARCWAQNTATAPEVFCCNWMVWLWTNIGVHWNFFQLNKFTAIVSQRLICLINPNFYTNRIKCPSPFPLNMSKGGITSYEQGEEGAPSVTLIKNDTFLMLGLL